VIPSRTGQAAAVFDGPFCLGVSSATVDVDLPWAVLVDASDKLVLDGQHRPQAREPSGCTVNAFAAIGESWLTPDVRNPARKRFLFQTRKIE
jgi:hypothetical protein